VPVAKFPSLTFGHLDGVILPRVARVRLKHATGNPIADVEGAVRDAVTRCERLKALPTGSEVAVALGSRGIAEIGRIGRTAVAAVREMGLSPFVVPAMGSHGGGTAEGQAEVLARLGMTVESLGAEIRSSMEVVDYGELEDGIRCKFDRTAAAAAAIIVINRVKSHTTFERSIESGLVKMTAVGLGNADGARAVHRTGPMALTDVLPRLAAISLEKSPIALGIALVENAQEKLVAIEAVAPEDFFEADKRLLVLAKSFIARLPFESVDALVVEEIGKDISGSGMDYAVTGRADLRSIPNPKTPFVSRIAVLGLSKATGGNGLGIGLADFTTVDVTDRIDLHHIYTNSLASTMAEKSRIPIVLANDLDALRATVSTSWSRSDPSTKLCLIRSTLHLDEILISESLAEEARRSPLFESMGDFFDLEFNGAGRLVTRVYAGET